MDEPLPCLLQHRNLKEPLVNAVQESEILEKKADTVKHDSTLLHGLFVLGLARYEVALGDILRYYLKHFPYKLKESEIRFPKDVFIHEQFELLEQAIERFITGASYKNFRDFHQLFLETLSIEPAYDEQELATVQELRARRNLLLHNRLVVNDQYQESCGLDPAPRKGDVLKIDHEYLKRGFKAVLGMFNAISKEIDAKYHNYTKVKAARELWAYMFKSPVMPFEDFWRVEGDDNMYCRTSPHEENLSGSERRMLGLWRSHFNSNGEFLKDFNIRLFDRRNQRKILQFISWNREHIFG
jgi:hypothetical protein